MLLVAVAAMSLAACGERTSADSVERQKTQQVTAQATKAVGFPSVTNFYEKRLLKEIYERRDQADLGTYAYVQGLDGRLTCLGEAIGYGVPYSTQFSNPLSDRYASGDEGSNGWRREFPMPQPEPNGLFTPEGMSATWLQLVDPESGDIHVVYVEPTIVVSPFKLSGTAINGSC